MKEIMISFLPKEGGLRKITYAVSFDKYIPNAGFFNFKMISYKNDGYLEILVLDTGDRIVITFDNVEDFEKYSEYLKSLNVVHNKDFKVESEINIPCLRVYCSTYEYMNAKVIHDDYISFEREDVLITDPCYIMREDSDNDWDLCRYGDNLDALGISKFITKSTYYGDWSCSVKDNSDNIIGTFCADAGLVSVMPYQEALKYNPEIEEKFRDSGEATIIRDFTGKVYIKSKFDIENKEWIRYVEGSGIINSTELLKFTSYQSGY